ncbi:MAG: SurA N-terminal domain-containing protein, partial [Christensenellaceae bacterium]|nr:SurA N-terminal domain-containing protein [Christensenellaceae bacterium]
MKIIWKALSLLLCLALLAGCGVVEVDESKVIVAKVGSENITKQEFTQALTTWLGQYGYTPDSTAIASQLPDLKTQLLDSMIQELVVG